MDRSVLSTSFLSTPDSKELKKQNITKTKGTVPTCKLFILIEEIVYQHIIMTFQIDLYQRNLMNGKMSLKCGLSEVCMVRQILS